MTAARHIPYFDFYPADFMNGVRGLSPQEVGVYTMVLCRIYEDNAPIEYNIVRLSTYCGMREKTFAKVLERLIELDKFQVEDGMISNRRAMAEISKRADKLKIASRAGKISGQKRQQKQHAEATDVGVPFNHTDTDTDKEKEEPKGSSKKAGRRLPDDWVPDEIFARRKGLSAWEVENEAEKFRDYWRGLSGQRAVKADWDATWRNWVRKAAGDRERKQDDPRLRIPGFNRF